MNGNNTIAMNDKQTSGWGSTTISPNTLDASRWLYAATPAASNVKISAALVRAQKKMGNATKDSKNPFFKSSYADLNSIREAVLPVFLEEGIAILQPTVSIDGKNYVRTLLLHESGEQLSCDTEIVVAKQNDPQAQGSGISYARRYGLQSFLNVGAVDDDGEAAMGRTSSPKTAAQKVPEASNEAPKAPQKAASFRAKKPEQTVASVQVPAISQESGGDWD